MVVGLKEKQMIKHFRTLSVGLRECVHCPDVLRHCQESMYWNGEFLTQTPLHTYNVFVLRKNAYPS